MADEQRPTGCGTCEFSRIPPGEDAGGGGIDEDEFECRLLGPEEVRRRNRDTDSWRVPELVWGEDPLCTDADWLGKYRRERDVLLEACRQLVGALEWFDDSHDFGPSQEAALTLGRETIEAVGDGQPDRAGDRGQR